MKQIESSMIDRSLEKFPSKKNGTLATLTIKKKLQPFQT